MGMEWYWVDRGERQGPVAEAALHELVRSGQVTRRTLVWNETMSEWVEAGKVPGFDFGDEAPPVQPGQAGLREPVLEHAGFWLRFLAHVIDQIIISVIGGVVALLFFGMIIFSISAAGASGSQGGAAAGGVIVIILFILGIGVLTFGPMIFSAWMHSSRHQGTPGKLMVGIKVTDERGGPISFWRALGRELSKILSGFFFCAGFIIAGFTEKKQALHDFIVATLVVRR